MPKSKPPYPAEFRQQIIELAREEGRWRSRRASSARPRRAFPTGLRKTRVTAARRCLAKRVGVYTYCRVLGVSASGYYDWLRSAPSARAMANVVLTEASRQAHRASDEIYGMPRIRAELQDAGHVVSRKRVARLMREAPIRGVSRRRSFTVTTAREPKRQPAPDLVNRRFRADAADQLWVADMTYIPTWTASCTWPSPTSSASVASASKVFIILIR